MEPPGPTWAELPWALPGPAWARMGLHGRPWALWKQFDASSGCKHHYEGEDGMRGMWVASFGGGVGISAVL